MKINKKNQPFTAQRATYGTFRQNFDFNLRGDHQNIAYERRDYESVDEKSLSKGGFTLGHKNCSNLIRLHAENCMQKSRGLLHYASNTEQCLKQCFGDCDPICDCVSKI